MTPHLGYFKAALVGLSSLAKTFLCHVNMSTVGLILAATSKYMEADVIVFNSIPTLVDS